MPVIELERWLYLNGRFADEEYPKKAKSSPNGAMDLR